MTKQKQWKNNKCLVFIRYVLSGYAQIAFNDHPVSGLLLLAATCIGSPIQAVSALWATIVATAVACFLGIPKELLSSGLYGFNAALAGLALPPLLFSGQSISISLLICSSLAGILCVFLTAGFGNLLGRWQLPSLAIPYCLAVILLLTACTLSGTIKFVPAQASVSASLLSSYTPLELIEALLNGISQIIWIGKPLCGLLYLAAVLPFSRLDVLNSLLGSLAATTAAIALGLPKETVLNGIYGLNGALLMNVLTRAFVPCAKGYALAILSAGFTTLIAAACQALLAPLGISTFLAIPYVTVCLLLFMGRDLFCGLSYIPPAQWTIPEMLFKKIENKK